MTPVQHLDVLQQYIGSLVIQLAEAQGELVRLQGALAERSKPVKRERVEKKEA